MEYARFKIDLKKYGLKRDDSWFLEPLSDVHFGNRNHATEKFLEAVHRIANQKNRSTLFNGDISENTPPQHKFFNSQSTDLDLIDDVQQEDAFINAIKPILVQHKKTKIKIFGSIMGNHEARTYGQNRFIKAYCRPVVNGQEIPINYLGDTGYVWLDFFYGKEFLRNFIILATHGSYGGSQIGGEVNQLLRLPANYEADIYLIGHSHQKHTESIYQQTIISKTDGSCELMERTLLFANCGTFLRSHRLGVPSYTEKKLLYSRVAKVGTITIEMNAYQGKLHAHE